MGSRQWIYFMLFRYGFFFHFKLIKNLKSVCSTWFDSFRLGLWVYVTGIDRNRRLRLILRSCSSARSACVVLDLGSSLPRVSPLQPLFLERQAPRYLVCAVDVVLCVRACQRVGPSNTFKSFSALCFLQSVPPSSSSWEIPSEFNFTHQEFSKW